jgi:hypothetical protein
VHFIVFFVSFGSNSFIFALPSSNVKVKSSRYRPEQALGDPVG